MLLQMLPDLGLGARAETQETQCPLIGSLQSIIAPEGIDFLGIEILTDSEAHANSGCQTDRLASLEADRKAVRVSLLSLDGGDPGH